MHLPARPFFYVEKNHHLLISGKAKLLIVCIIFLASCLSGKLPVPKEQYPEEPAVKAAESAYNPEEITTENKYDHNQSQIKIITIGQKSSPRPTMAPTSTPAPANEVAWGVAKQIDTHTYTMQVAPDNKTGTAQEILNALNNYRRQHGSGGLTWDNALAGYAAQRAEYFIKINKLDSHDGFFDFLNNQDGFNKLGFSYVGENSSLGFTLESVHLIEWVYAGDEGHNSNQLDKTWQYVGIGVNGTATDLIFAKDKM